VEPVTAHRSAPFLPYWTRGTSSFASWAAHRRDEAGAHRSIYHDGWRAVCPFPGTSFTEAGVGFGALELDEDRLRELDATGWELYHVEVDPTESNDLDFSDRPKLIEMIALWCAEAGKYHVLPLDSRGTMRFAEPRPEISVGRDTYVYRPGTQVVPENAAVKLLNRAHDITADVELSESDEGVVVCHGSNVGGYTMFVQDGLLHYVHNYVGARELHLASSNPVGAGKHTLRYEFTPTAPLDLMAGKGTPGHAKLLVDGGVVAEADFPVTIPLALGIGSGLAVGRNPGSPISERYSSQFAFTGTIDEVTITTGSAEHHDEDEARRTEARVAMDRL
jgi:arylsulfatase